MNYFHYEAGSLCCEETKVTDLAARVGTPCFVYSAKTISHHCHAIREGFREVSPLICYSVKANSSLAICDLLNREGAGFDVVSGGELYRTLKIGADPSKIVYAGVGKTIEEQRYALREGILMFNVESDQELSQLDQVARSMGQPARVALRLNPDVDPKTHVYTTTGKKENKFGIDLAKAKALVARLDQYEGIELAGFHTHLGSPIFDADPYVQALEKVNAFIDECREQGRSVEWINTGGGFAIEYRGGEAQAIESYAKPMIPLIQRTGCKLIMEPGRFIVGNSGILVTKVLYVKTSGDKRFLVCDAGMNDLIRPSLYEAFHRIWPVECSLSVEDFEADPGREGGPVDIVGPVCESGDFFAKDRRFPPVEPGALLAVFGAGAYGQSMSSNYNSRLKACEVLVTGSDSKVVRERETYDDLVRHDRW